MKTNREIPKSIFRFIRNESGSTAIEYALIAFLISIAGIVSSILIGGTLEESFVATAQQIVTALTGGS